MADKTVAVADLFIKGKSFGPHAFVMNLRENGKPVPGVQFDGRLCGLLAVPRVT